MSIGSLPAPLRADGGTTTVPYRICFVCTGNICRSPMADVVTRALAANVNDDRGEVLGGRLSVSSAGTSGWHEGEPMDPRTRVALEHAGYADHGHLGRQFQVDWFATTDLVVALDRRHRQILRSLAGSGDLDERIVMLRDFDRLAGGAVDVADPYYGDREEFAQCLSTIEAACRGLVTQLGAALNASSP